jgi:hypothetical protein
MMWSGEYAANAELGYPDGRCLLWTFAIFTSLTPRSGIMPPTTITSAPRATRWRAMVRADQTEAPDGHHQAPCIVPKAEIKAAVHLLPVFILVCCWLRFGSRFRPELPIAVIG